MFEYTAKSIISAAALVALSAGLAACGPGTDVTQVEIDESANPTALVNRSGGLPSFLVPPHERGMDEGALAKIADGYYYQTGEMGDGVSFGIYSYFDGSWNYVSSSIWGEDGSSLSNGTDVSASGEVWSQAGFYDVDAEGTTLGTYFTSYLDTNQVATIYYTEYEATAERATYRSTIDYSNTGASPDCDYISEWKEDFSAAYQMCERMDGSWWSCDSTYTYLSTTDEEGVTVTTEYASEQVCFDSRTEASPDYTLSEDTRWDYMADTYTNVAEMMCFEEGGVQRHFTYVFQDGYGIWYDEASQIVSSPTCGWSQE